MPDPDRSAYPAAAREDHVDQLHGISVEDPYRYLEDPDADRTVAFVAAQNRLSRPFLDGLETRKSFLSATTHMLTAPRTGVPWARGGRYFAFANNGELDQDLLRTGSSPTDLRTAGHVVLDPNGWSTDGTIALTGLRVTPDGHRMVYTRSSGGSDWRTVHVLDLPHSSADEKASATRDFSATEAPVEHPDVLRAVKFADPEWLPDRESFVYWRYPEALDTDEQDLSDALGAGELARHRIGDAQSDDEIIWRPPHPEWGMDAWACPDGGWLLMVAAPGTDSRTTITARRLTAGPDGRTIVGPDTTIVGDLTDAHSVVHAQGNMLYLRTERDAPTGRLVRCRLDDPAAPWTTLAAGDGGRVLVDAIAVRGGFVLVWSVDTAQRLELVDADGGRPIALGPVGPASYTGVHGQPDSSELFFGTTGFDHRQRVYRVDLTHPEAIEQLPESTGAVQLRPTVSRRLRAPSADGTPVPMSVVARTDLPAGPRPTLLYGYGGFDIALTPGFSAMFASWIDSGGVLAVANLRGGGEFGRAWHEAGMLEHKQRVFDDLFGCAEFLVAAGLTTPSQLAVHGRSNGGLLVGAALTQRPELWAAALPTVGVLDMLRFHKFTIGWAWISEYGSADDPELSRELHRYSPLHALQPGRAYPPTLICTGDHDDRVVPAHSLKFGAQLQFCQARSFVEAPVLLRVDVRAGHGAGKPARAVAAEYADQLAFAAHFTGLVPLGGNASDFFVAGNSS